MELGECFNQKVQKVKERYCLEYDLNNRTIAPFFFCTTNFKWFCLVVFVPVTTIIVAVACYYLLLF